jgi:hypothetical protein
VQIFLDQIRNQTGIFFHGPRYFFHKNYVNIITAVVNINIVIADSITFHIICLVQYKLFDWKSSILIINIYIYDRILRNCYLQVILG